jgi:hypothetical protein
MHTKGGRYVDVLAGVSKDTKKNRAIRAARRATACVRRVSAGIQNKAVQAAHVTLLARFENAITTAGYGCLVQTCIPGARIHTGIRPISALKHLRAQIDLVTGTRVPVTAAPIEIIQGHWCIARIAQERIITMHTDGQDACSRVVLA